MHKRGFHYRCSRKACQRRRTLPRLVEHYIRPPRCACGSKEWRRDLNRTHTWMQQRPCECSGYGFLHRRGSKFCTHATAPLTEQDIATRYGTAGDPMEQLYPCPF